MWDKSVCNSFDRPKLYFDPLSMKRALLEQKQKKKRQEPLMVQSSVDGRSRARRTKQSEEQAPLVESYLSSNSSTIYHGRFGSLAARS